MKFFIDTANINEIKEANALGVLAGVTTNPSLVAKEGVDFHERIREICSVVEGPVSAEVISLEADKMIEEGKRVSENCSKRCCKSSNDNRRFKSSKSVL